VTKILSTIKSDFSASVVVFFIAIPLCLGIAHASGVPLFSGIIAGVIGGVVVGILSGSQLGVSGPAAGLVAVVISSLAMLDNSWQAFLLCVVMAGLIQIVAGALGWGLIAYYFPSSVIKGMLSGIGLVIIIKQLPHALGFDLSLHSTTLAIELNHYDAISQLLEPIKHSNPGALLITILSFIVLLGWEQYLLPRYRIFKVLQGPLLVVILGIILNYCYQNQIIPFTLYTNQVVNLPIPEHIIDFFNLFVFPDFSQLTNVKIYQIAFVIALIASVETLLCVEATDKLDPHKRITPANRELIAQGVGNICSGLIGGLPITQVIVRSSANITFGAQTKMSTIFHGILILICVLIIPQILNMIPLAALAVILIMIGYKLTKPSIYVEMYKAGWEQFIPFIATILGIIFYSLLAGVAIGMTVGIFIIIRHNYRNSHHIIKDHENLHYHINLAEEVSFLNKGSILKELENLPANSTVLINAKQSKYIDYDVLEIIQNFAKTAKEKDINVILEGIS
jgi:MFS superfamily sulfate permease-like transporter